MRHDDPPSNQVVHDSSLRGRTVISADGRVLGEITTLAVDVSDWRVVAIRVKLDTVAAERIGARRSWLHRPMLEIPTSSVQSAGDTVLLSVPLDALRSQAPGTDEHERAPVGAHPSTP